MNHVLYFSRILAQGRDTVINWIESLKVLNSNISKFKNISNFFLIYPNFMDKNIYKINWGITYNI